MQFEHLGQPKHVRLPSKWPPYSRGQLEMRAEQCMDDVYYTEHESEQAKNVQIHSSTDQNEVLKEWDMRYVFESSNP